MILLLFFLPLIFAQCNESTTCTECIVGGCEWCSEDGGFCNDTLPDCNATLAVEDCPTPSPTLAPTFTPTVVPTYAPSPAPTAALCNTVEAESFECSYLSEVVTSEVRWSWASSVAGSWGAQLERDERAAYPIAAASGSGQLRIATEATDTMEASSNWAIMHVPTARFTATGPFELTFSHARGSLETDEECPSNVTFPATVFPDCDGVFVRIGSGDYFLAVDLTGIPADTYVQERVQLDSFIPGGEFFNSATHVEVVFVQYAMADPAAVRDQGRVFDDIALHDCSVLTPYVAPSCGTVPTPVPTMAPTAAPTGAPTVFVNPTPGPTALPTPHPTQPPRPTPSPTFPPPPPPPAKGSRDDVCPRVWADVAFVLDGASVVTEDAFVFQLVYMEAAAKVLFETYTDVRITVYQSGAVGGGGSRRVTTFRDNYDSFVASGLVPAYSGRSYGLPDADNALFDAAEDLNDVSPVPTDPPFANRKRIIFWMQASDANIDGVGAAVKAAGVELFTVQVTGSNALAPFVNGVDADRLRLAASHPTTYHSQVVNVHDLFSDRVDQTNPVIAASVALNRARGSPGAVCAMFGQGHVITGDGLAYDMQDVGDFDLLHVPASTYVGELRVQVRYAPCDLASASSVVRCVEGDCDDDDRDQPRSLACLRGVAITAEGGSIALHYTPEEDTVHIFENGELAVRSSTYTPAGSFVVHIAPMTGSGFHLQANMGDASLYAFFRPAGGSIAVRPGGVARGRTVGLCGHFDGCLPFDELTRRNGVVSDPDSQTSINTFVRSWRVHAKDSIFSYLPNERFDNLDWAPLDSEEDEASVTDESRYADPIGTCDGLSGTPLVEGCRRDAAVCACGADESGASDIFDLQCMFACAKDGTGGFLHIPIPGARLEDCSCPAVGSTPISLHTRYGEQLADGASLDSGEVAMPPHQLVFDGGRDVFFRAALGGRYTIELEASTCSADVTRVEAVVECDTVEFSVSAGERKVVSTVPGFGYPLVRMEGSTDASPSEILAVSWNFTRLPESARGVTPQLMGETSLRPMWIPTSPGVYELEVAVYDGCFVERDSVEVSVECSSCSVVIVMDDAMPSLTWNEGLGTFVTTSAYARRAPSGGVDYAWTLANISGGYKYPYYEDPTSPGTYYFTLDTSLLRETVTRVSLGTNDTTSTTVEAAPIFHPDRPGQQVLSAERHTEVTSRCSLTEVQNYTEWSNVPGSTTVCTLTLDQGPAERVRVTAEDIVGPFEAHPCIGDYVVHLRANGSCVEDGDDDIVVSVACNDPPVVTLDLCEQQYDEDNALQYIRITETFPTVTLSSRGTYDPNVDDPLADLFYRWSARVSGNSSESVLGGSSNYSSGVFSCTTSECHTVDFTPDVEGTYEVTLEVSDGCSVRSTSQSFVSDCVASPSMSIGGPGGTTNGSSVALSVGSAYAYTAQRQASSGITADADQVDVSVIVEAPAARAAFVDFLRAADDLASSPSGFGTDVSFNVRPDFGGEWTVTARGNDGCRYVDASYSLTFTCDESNPLSANLTTDAGTTDIKVYQEEGGAWPTLQLNASASENPGVFDNYGLPNQVINGIAYLSYNQLDGSAAAPIFPNVDRRLATWTPFVGGTFVLEVLVHDGCRAAVAAVTVEAIERDVVDVGCTSVLDAVLDVDDEGVPIVSNYRPSGFADAKVSASLCCGATYSTNVTSHEWTVMRSPVNSLYTSPTGDAVSTVLTTTEEVFAPTILDDGLSQLQLTNVGECNETTATRTVLDLSGPEERFGACFTPDVPGTYELALLVTDEVAGCTVEVGRRVVEARCNSVLLPVVVANVTAAQDGSVAGFGRVLLDASASSEASQGSRPRDLTARWSLVDGPPASALHRELDAIASDRSLIETLLLSVEDDGIEDDVAQVQALLNQTIADAARAYSDSVVTNARSMVASFTPDSAGYWYAQLVLSDGCSSETILVEIDVPCTRTVEIDGSTRVTPLATDAGSIGRLAVSSVALSTDGPAARRYDWRLVEYVASGAGPGRTREDEAAEVGMIAGVTVGVVCFLCICVLLVCVVRSNRNNGQGADGSAAATSGTSIRGKMVSVRALGRKDKENDGAVEMASARSEAGTGAPVHSTVEPAGTLAGTENYGSVSVAAAPAPSTDTYDATPNTSTYSGMPEADGQYGAAPTEQPLYAEAPNEYGTTPTPAAPAPVNYSGLPQKPQYDSIERPL